MPQSLPDDNSDNSPSSVGFTETLDEISFALDGLVLGLARAREAFDYLVEVRVGEEGLRI